MLNFSALLRSASSPLAWKSARRKDAARRSCWRGVGVAGEMQVTRPLESPEVDGAKSCQVALITKAISEIRDKHLKVCAFCPLWPFSLYFLSHFATLSIRLADGRLWIMLIYFYRFAGKVNLIVIFQRATHFSFISVRPALFSISARRVLHFHEK